jgi:hypothetical protein
VRQCKLLGLSRAGLYRLRTTPSVSKLDLMKRIDKLHMAYPYMVAPEKNTKPLISLDNNRISRYDNSHLFIIPARFSGSLWELPHAW